MHRAPAVSFSVTRSRWQGRGIVALSCLAWLALGAFMREQTPFDERTVLLVLATVFSSAVALLGWRRSPQGRLRWDGQQWSWSGFAASPSCRLTLLVDFQRLVLVSLVAHRQAPVWLWLEASADDVTWKALRRAIISSRGASNENGDETLLASEGDIR